MNIPYYIADAFTDQVFHGNPAGICIPEHPLSDSTMQAIAKENNLSETAFLSKIQSANKQIAEYQIRWFTPEGEIDLCGHATLASAFILTSFIETDTDCIRFHSPSGILNVRKKGTEFEMEFPVRSWQPLPAASQYNQMIGCTPSEIYIGRDLFLVLDHASQVANAKPDFAYMKTQQDQSDWLGVVITAPGDSNYVCDFVSRYFCPELNIHEDPVTGSSHCNLIPYWSHRLHKPILTAMQISQRGGILNCEYPSSESKIVKIRGKATLYLKGDLII